MVRTRGVKVERPLPAHKVRISQAKRANLRPAGRDERLLRNPLATHLPSKGAIRRFPDDTREIDHLLGVKPTKIREGRQVTEADGCLFDPEDLRQYRVKARQVIPCGDSCQIAIDVLDRKSVV